LKPEAYTAFTETLVRSLTADPRVIGLIAAGSMAQTERAPDEWSDHDFWIVTVPGAQDHFRSVHDWLPEATRLVLAFRETAHGVKLLYDQGHLIEYAVFDEAELDVVPSTATGCCSTGPISRGDWPPSRPGRWTKPPSAPNGPIRTCSASS
jgi:hypothetical protein